MKDLRGVFWYWELKNASNETKKYFMASLCKIEVKLKIRFLML